MKWRKNNLERAKEIRRRYNSRNPGRTTAARRYDPEYYKNWNLKRKYGIDLTLYDQLSRKQGERCAICSTHKSELKRGLMVDHCHRTGKVRGLLCDRCNIGLGKFQDSVERIKQAVYYLQLGVQE